MELKDFIKTTISQIADAVEELNDEYKDKGMIVNPRTFYPIEQLSQVRSGNLYSTIINVDFDLDLVVENSNKKGGNIGVFAGALKMGGSLGNNESSKSANRLKFSVPIMLHTPRPPKDNAYLSSPIINR